MPVTSENINIYYFHTTPSIAAAGSRQTKTKSFPYSLIIENPYNWNSVQTATD